MDGKALLGPAVSLIKYNLQSCKSETMISQEISSGGGELEITSELYTPDLKVLNLGDKYTLALGMKVVGKLKGTQDIAFFAECKFEGLYQVTSCREKDVKVVADPLFWSVPFSQLSPIVSQFINDTLSKMGLRDIVVPPVEMGGFAEIVAPRGKRLKEKKQA